MDGKAVGYVTAALVFVITLLPDANADEPGFYVGAAVNRVEQDAKGEGEMLVAVSGPFGYVVSLRPDQVEIDDLQTGWNVTLGYRANQYVAAELAYYDFGEASVTERYSPDLFPLPSQITVRSKSHVYGPGLSLLGTLPLTASLSVFARGSVLFVDQEIERIQSTFSTKATIGDNVLMAGAGAQWAFTPRWTARLEYQRTEDIDAGSNSSSLFIIPQRMGTRQLDQLSLSVLFNL